MQFPTVLGHDDGSIWVHTETILAHSGGHRESFSLPLPCAKRDAHGIGSAITYGRRYGLAAAVGVAPEDDDGNAASEGGQVKSAPTARREQKKALSKEQKDRMDKFLKSVDVLIDDKKEPDEIIAFYGANLEKIEFARKQELDKAGQEALERLDAAYKLSLAANGDASADGEKND